MLFDKLHIYHRIALPNIGRRIVVKAGYKNVRHVII